MWLSFQMFDFFRYVDNNKELHIIHSYNELYIPIFFLLILLLFNILTIVITNKKVILINSDRKEDIPSIDFLKKEKELKILFKIFLIYYKKIMRDKRPDIDRKKDLDSLISWFDSYLSESYLKINKINIDEKFVENEINNCKEIIKKIYLSIDEE